MTLYSPSKTANIKIVTSVNDGRPNEVWSVRRESVVLCICLSEPEMLFIGFYLNDNQIVKQIFISFLNIPEQWVSVVESKHE